MTPGHFAVPDPGSFCMTPGHFAVPDPGSCCLTPVMNAEMTQGRESRNDPGS
jgi:hypothetical protein